MGATLWWAEGTKSRRDKRWSNAVSYPLEITSTDPNIVKIFLEFVRKDIKVDEKRLRVQLQIHENDDKLKLENYWSKICSIEKQRFHKTIIRPVGNKVGKTRGTCKIRYHDKEKYFKTLEILHSVMKEIGIGE